MHPIAQKLVDDLRAMLEAPGHEEWTTWLTDSLREAKKIALDQGMERAQKWPEDLDAYCAWIAEYVETIPRQDYPRETFDRLSEWYWLIDQPTGRKLQESPEFNAWMNEGARAWGMFLNTPESAKYVDTYRNDPAYHMEQYVTPPGDFPTFNAFFDRDTKPGMRPVAGMRCDSIIVNPADCTFKSKARITHDSRVRFKFTHEYSILELLKGSPYRDRFDGGLYVHSFLGPADYHHFRAPVRGTVLESRKQMGRVFLEVQLVDGQFQAPDSAEGGYEFRQMRGILILDSPLGLVAVIPIGMAQVSSVNMTAVPGSYLEKGDRFGFFAFGGSDMILLFPEGSGVEFTAPPGVHFNANQCIGEVLR